MWMLVNATIFAEGPEGPITLIDALVEIVNGSIEVSTIDYKVDATHMLF